MFQCHELNNQHKITMDGSYLKIEEMEKVIGVT